MYVPVVTLSTENDKILLEQLRTGFKRNIEWNKYRSEMILLQTISNNLLQNNKLIYLIDPLKMKKIEHLFQSIMYQMFK